MDNDKIRADVLVEFSSHLLTVLSPIFGIEEMSGPAFTVLAIKTEAFCRDNGIGVMDLTIGQVRALLMDAQRRYEEIFRA